MCCHLTKMGLDCHFVSRKLTKQEDVEGEDTYKTTSHILDVLGVQHSLLRVIDHMPYTEFNLRGYHLVTYQVLREDIWNFVGWLLTHRTEENKKHYKDGVFRQYWTDKRLLDQVCAETDAQILLSFVKELDDMRVPLHYYVVFT